MLRFVKKSIKKEINKQKSSKNQPNVFDSDQRINAINELNAILNQQVNEQINQESFSETNKDFINDSSPKSLYSNLLDSVKNEKFIQPLNNDSKESIEFRKLLFPHLLYEGEFKKASPDSSKHTNRSKPLLDEVRQKLNEAFNANQALYYKQDIDKVMTDDWYLKRYLLARRRNVQNTVHMVLESFSLRKQLGFRDCDWTYFPNETHCLGALFSYAPDREGNITLYMRIKAVYREEVLQKLIKQYSAKYLCELEECAKTPLTIIVDFSGTGWANADLDLLFFAINYLTRYTPSMVHRILLLDMPWILRKTYKTIQRFIPEEQREFLQIITHKELIQDIVDPLNAPDYVGGHCKIPYCGWIRSHPDSPNLIDFGFDHFPEFTFRKALHYSQIYLFEIYKNEPLSIFHQKFLEMLKKALSVLGPKATCRDVITRYPQIKSMTSTQRFEFLCKLMEELNQEKENLMEPLTLPEASSNSLVVT